MYVCTAPLHVHCMDVGLLTLSAPGAEPRGAPQSYLGGGGTLGLNQRGEGGLKGVLGLCH